MHLSEKLVDHINQKRPDPVALTVEQTQQLAQSRTIQVGHLNLDDMKFYENFGDDGHRVRNEPILWCPIVISWSFEKIYKNRVFYSSKLSALWVGGQEGIACLESLQQAWYRLDGDSTVINIDDIVALKSHIPVDMLHLLNELADTL
jgi:hypothetical protein